MSFSIVLCVVAVQALSLGLLWIALRVSMARVVRPLIAVGGVSGAWAAWLLVLVFRGPPSMWILAGSVFAVSAVALGITIHLATVEEERPNGGEGGAPTVSPAGPSGGGDDEPPWWPEFQREVAEYAARRERDDDREPERARQPVSS